MTRRRLKLEISIVLLWIVVVGLVYRPSLDHEFVFDDHPYITQNDYVQRGLTAENIVWAFDEGAKISWQPITWLSFMLDYEVYGLNPFGYHLTNICLHVINSLLLLYVLWRMTGVFWPSVLVSALFALHPINVESVVWISQRKNVLFVLFWMLAMWAYLWYSRRPNIRRYLWVSLFFVLGMMSKLMMVTFPMAMLLLDYWPLDRFGPDRRITRRPMVRLVLEKLPWVIPAAGIAFIMVFFDVNRQMSDIGRPMSLRLANALVTYVKYIAKAVRPTDLAVWYPFPAEVPLWQVLGAAFLLISISGMAISFRCKRPYLLVGWLWYLGVMFPAMGLVQSVNWPAMSDHHAYLPAVGLFIMAAWGLSDLTAGMSGRRITAAVFSGLVLAGLVIIAGRQTGYWRNDLVLYERAVEVTPNNPLARNNLGSILVRKNRFDEAIYHFQEVLRTHPDNATARLNMGVTLNALGRYREADEFLRQALSLKPNADAYAHLGINMLNLGKVEEARLLLEEALRINPENKAALPVLGKLPLPQESKPDK